ncbi:hypothetical protein [Streptomyces nogalater]|uniref:DNA primase/polymerase bifunctional N-terminal domain-containing protein n=1 Tax=Streptomyces nogalater TaxID=38314 RepID=A0ABW0WE52_STRNO
MTRVNVVQALTSADYARRVAAESWLLQAAPHKETAGIEWSQQAVALLTAGVTWDAVRVPYEVLDPAYNYDTEPLVLRRRLDELSVDGAVFCDPHRPCLYVMVPPGTDRLWPQDADVVKLGVDCLGGTLPYIRLVGVPRLDRTEPPGSYWLLPPDKAGRRHASAKNLYNALHACVRTAVRQVIS